MLPELKKDVPDSHFTDVETEAQEGDSSCACGGPVQASDVDPGLAGISASLPPSMLMLSSGPVCTDPWTLAFSDSPVCRLRINCRERQRPG